MSNPNYQWLMKQSKPASRWLFINIALGVLAGVLIISQSWLLATIIDRVSFSRIALHTLLIVLLLIVVLRAGISSVREIISFRTANTVKKNVRDKCLQQLMQLTPLELSQHKTGELISTLIEQVEALHGFFADYFPQMMIVCIVPVIIVVMVFLQNWIAGFVLLLSAPLIITFMILIGMGTAKLNQENFKVLAKMSAYFLNLLQGLTTLSLFNQARAQLNSIEKVSDEFRQKTMKILRVAFLNTAALELFSTISIAIIAVYLGLGLLGFLHIGFDGVHISLQSALFILLLAPEFFMPLRQLGTFYHARAEAMGAATDIIKISTRIPSKQEPEEFSQQIGSHNKDASEAHPVGVNATHGIATSLMIKNLSFAYSNNKKILDQVDFEIKSGNCVAVTGSSGSGKSTLLNLLLKFLTPLSGKILVGDIDLQDIDADAWREKITLLHQNVRLFSGTILENILLAKPTASENEIDHAIQLSGVLDFTKNLSGKLNTVIHENNTGLSGGQIQRIALARIILKDAPIILLDEPTSYLDKSNVELILRLLQWWHGKKTIVIATHDERILKIADVVRKLDCAHAVA